MDGTRPMLFGRKRYDADSVFQPENLLREARRQRRLPPGDVPDVCILDPDGDIQAWLRDAGRSARCEAWACYHTELDVFGMDGERFGIVGRAVGASFAVLVAEQLFASGCRLLVSLTSAGQVAGDGPTNYFVLVDRALRDEGTSLHYLPPSATSDADPVLADAAYAALADAALAGAGKPVLRGLVWTTDAPYRETESAIAEARTAGAIAVEMEAAALYAFAQARGQAVLCFAHVTNAMAQTAGDFEKGAQHGTQDALAVVAAAVRGWRGMLAR